MNAQQAQPFTLETISQAHARLADYVRETPVMDYAGPALPDGTVANFKFELLQQSGTFKARGAFTNLLGLSDEAKARGVTCVSAGNHAVAVAYAAHRLGVKAKTVMIKTASPARVALCRQYGADIIFADDGQQAFDIVRGIEQNEKMSFIHPFSTYPTVLGTATLGYEWLRQAGELDAVILPVGGGGLAAGVSAAVKLRNPACRVYGIEPEGANVMARSFAAGAPQKMGPMSSIADSLMAPHTDAYSYQICRDNIDRLATVTEDQIRQGMLMLFSELKLAVEPACAVATAALMHPLRQELAGKRVGVLLCGTNTDPATYMKHLGAAIGVAG
ncbi:MAG: threonine/serine dehydratase [Alcaligenaceae bacterium]|nr:threonine/serine dehydratase [Alcaligenaceae bacterium]